MTIFKDSHHFSRTMGDVWWQSLMTALFLKEPFAAAFGKKPKHPLFSQWSYCLRRFSLPKSLVRGHGRICSPHPPLPWPREAARGPKRRRSRLRSAAVFCLGSRGPTAKPAKRTRRNGRGEKFWENSQKILAPQKSKFWKLWPNPASNVLRPSTGLNTRVGFVFYWSRISHVGSQDDLEKWR